MMELTISGSSLSSHQERIEYTLVPVVRGYLTNTLESSLLSSLASLTANKVKQNRLLCSVMPSYLVSGI